MRIASLLKRLCLTPLAVILLSAFAAAPASADPLLVTSGLYSVHGGDPTFFRFIGDDFSLLGDGVALGVGPVMDCPQCMAGTSIDLGANVTLPGAFGATAAGSATIGGTSYPSVFYSGNLIFSAPTVTAPPLTGRSNVTFAEPFTFTGQLTGFGTAARNTAPLFSTALTGTGTVTFTMIGTPGFTFDYSYANADYVFSPGQSTSPTPEPATLLLLGSGIVVVARRFRLV